jgi:hypothetical protein
VEEPPPSAPTLSRQIIGEQAVRVGPAGADLVGDAAAKGVGIEKAACVPHFLTISQ